MVTTDRFYAIGYKNDPLWQRLEQAARVAPLDMLTLAPPMAATFPVDMADPRVRALRDDPSLCFMFRRDRFGRFWYREWPFVALRSAIMLRSAWLNGRAVPATMAELAGECGLSARTVQATIARAASTGDLSTTRSASDGRRLVIDPSPEMLAETLALARSFIGSVARFLDRPDPMPGLPAQALPEAQRVLWASSRHTIGARDRAARLTSRRTFVFLMWDLLLEGPLPARRFIPAEARRLCVTPMTIRNMLDHAGSEGWLAPGPDLAGSAMAARRVAAMLTGWQLRWTAMLDVLDAIGARARADAA